MRSPPSMTRTLAGREVRAAINCHAWRGRQGAPLAVGTWGSGGRAECCSTNSLLLSHNVCSPLARSRLAGGPPRPLHGLYQGLIPVGRPGAGSGWAASCSAAPAAGLAAAPTAARRREKCAAMVVLQACTPRTPLGEGAGGPSGGRADTSKLPAPAVGQSFRIHADTDSTGKSAHAAGIVAIKGKVCFASRSAL